MSSRGGSPEGMLFGLLPADSSASGGIMGVRCDRYCVSGVVPLAVPRGGGAHPADESPCDASGEDGMRVTRT
jgi:hypothetical protein